MSGESECIPFVRVASFRTITVSNRRIESSETITTESRYPLSESLTLTAIQVSHGTDPAHSTPTSKESYVSTAFFIRNEETESEFLFYGDVEPGQHCSLLSLLLANFSGC